MEYRSRSSYRQPEESFERSRPRSQSRGGGRRRVATEDLVRERDFIEEDRIRRDTDNDRIIIRRSDIVETRARSPSPRRTTHRRARSISPHDEEVDRIRREEIIHKHTSSPRGRERGRSPSQDTRLRSRFDERRHSLEDYERTETRIVEKERRVARSPESSRSPSPEPEPEPPVIRGPTIEREVVTHYRDIDHGMIQAKPEPRFTHVRHRSQSRPRFTEIDILKQSIDEIRVSDTHVEEHIDSRRRSRSAAPMSPSSRDEAEYITSRVDSRGRMGEARGGITKDWAIVDVPPGTERVRMDGAGGAQVDVHWTEYSGQRRSDFVPDRERERDRDDNSYRHERRRSRSVHRDRYEDDINIHRSSTADHGRGDIEREVHIEKVTDRKITRPASSHTHELWTEIPKHLIVPEAIRHMRYEFQEARDHYRIMDRLEEDHVVELMEISDDIRRRRRERSSGLDRVDDWERAHRIRPMRGFEDSERIAERRTFDREIRHR